MEKGTGEVVSKKLQRLKFKKGFPGVAPVFIVLFAVVGVVVLAITSASPPQGLRAANNPKAAMGVSGTTHTRFARWLDRGNIQSDISYGETNKHFSPAGIDTIFKQVSNKDNRTRIITINPLPDQTQFMPDRTKPVEQCGTVGTSPRAVDNDYRETNARFQGEKTAKSLLGNFKVDNNENGVRDNLESLYRASIGCFDNTYELIADSIIKYNAYEPNPNGTPQFVIRFGHEVDGDFFEWSGTNTPESDPTYDTAMQLTGGKNAEELFVESWRRAHDIVTSKVSEQDPNSKVYWEYNTRYRIALNGNISRLERLYPGDDYVDVVGIDFYDRLYSNDNCIEVQPTDIQVPDCRSQQEKETSWAGTKRAIDAMSDFAAQRGKLVGVSEVHVSTTQKPVRGKPYWQQGGDNTYFVEQMYQWMTEQTTEKGRLAYMVFFERNGQNVSKEVSADLGAANLKSIHKIAPGYTNSFQVPADDPNATCSLQWDYYPLDQNGNPDTSQPKTTHYSLFPKSAVMFLKLFSGPRDNEAKKSDHPNCRAIGVVDGEIDQNFNVAPSVSLPQNLNAVVGTPLALSATVSDDGRPNNALTFSWTEQPDSPSVSFTNSSQRNTNVTFSAEGDYTLQLTVSDGDKQTSSQVSVSVQPESNSGGDGDEPTTSSQFVLMDATITHDGTRFISQTVEGPSNWETPVNYKDGMAYARLEVIDVPDEEEDKNLLAQACFFRNGVQEQTCSQPVPFSSQGVAYSTIGEPSSADWFKRGGSWDFTKAIESGRIQLKDADTGKNLLTQNCGNSCSTEAVVNALTPIVLRMQVVIVAQNSNIQALDNWLLDVNCTVEFGCDGESSADAPVVQIENPSTTVANGDTPIRVDATDNNAIDRVEVRVVGGDLLGVATEPPYEVTLDTSTLPNGDYTVAATAYDDEDNATTSSEITVKVRDPDFNRDDRVGIRDLSELISAWNQGNNQIETDIRYDLDDDGQVGFADLITIISNWTG